MSHSPIVKVEYDDEGNAFAAPVDLGEIKDSSTHEPSLYEDESNTRGELQYAGEQDRYNIDVFDGSKRAALVTKWKAGDRIDVRLTRADGTTITVLDILPRCGPVQNNVNAGAKSMWQFIVYKHID